MKHSYVQALIKSILGGTASEVALDNLKATLVAKGHLRLWSQILRATLRELSVKLKADAPQVAVAKAGSVSNDVLKKAVLTLGSNIEPTVIVDETLIGGFTVRVKGAVIDASYKRQLLALYRGIIASDK
jgi:F0F1-type ATP synthase delta subunit